MIRTLKIWLAIRRLNRLVAARRESFEVRDFAKRREAGKLGWQRRRTA